MSDTGYAMEPPTEYEDEEFIDEVLTVEMEDDSLYEDPHRTWGEFKKQVEEHSITDDMEVSYIDWNDSHDVDVHINKDKSFNVT